MTMKSLNPSPHPQFLCLEELLLPAPCISFQRDSVYINGNVCFVLSYAHGSVLDILVCLHLAFILDSVSHD